MTVGRGGKLIAACQVHFAKIRVEQIPSFRRLAGILVELDIATQYYFKRMVFDVLVIGSEDFAGINIIPVRIISCLVG